MHPKNHIIYHFPVNNYGMVPPQIGPVGPELIIILLIALLLLLIPIGLGYWVYNDATKRGRDNATLWAVVVFGLSFSTLIGGLVAVGVYIYTRE